MSNLTKNVQDSRTARRRYLLGISPAAKTALPAEIEENDITISDILKFGGIIIAGCVGFCASIFALYLLLILLAP